MTPVIIAAVVICGLQTPVQDCNQRTAENVVFTPYVYEQSTLPLVCFRESMAYVLSAQKVGAHQYARIYCGRENEIRNRFGTI